MKSKQEKRTDRYRVMCRIAFCLVILMTVAAIVFFNRAQKIEFPGLGEIHVTLSIAGLFVSSAIFAMVILDKRETGEEDYYFLQELFLLAMSLFFDMGTWYLYKRADHFVMNYIFNGLTYVFAVTSINCFYKYFIHTILKNQMPEIGGITKAFNITEWILLLLIITNPLTKWIYDIGPEGTFTVHGMSYLILAFLCAVCIALVIITYRSTVNREQKAAIYAFCLFTVAAKFLTGGANTELIYPLWIVIMIWCFIVIYDQRRREMEMKNRDIQIADTVLSGILPNDGSKLPAEIQALVDEHTIPAAMQAVEELTRSRVKK